MENYVGVLLPPIIDYVNQFVAKRSERVLMTIIICFIVACIFDWSLIANGNYQDIAAILRLTVVLCGEAMTVYNVWWKQSKVRVALPGNGVAALPFTNP